MGGGPRDLQSFQLDINDSRASAHPPTPTATMIDHSKYHPAYDPRFMHFPSRRSTVFSTKGMVACSQPLGELTHDV